MKIKRLFLRRSNNGEWRAQSRENKTENQDGEETEMKKRKQLIPV